MTELYNLQRKVAVDTSSLQTFAEELANSVDETEGRGFAGALVSDRRMRELNNMFRGKDTTTDVLSFPHEPFEFESKSSPPYEGGVAAASADGVVLSPGEEPPEGGTQNFLGDIVISAETAERQARPDDRQGLRRTFRRRIITWSAGCLLSLLISGRDRYI